jgi:hypothetical protein
MSGANFDVIFKGNQTIEDVAVSYGVIPDGAFYGCTALRYVTLFDGVTDIGNSAFAEIGNDIHPVSVVLPKNSYYTIDDCAFYAAYIEHIDIGGYIGYLGSKAFGESSLKEVVIRGNIDAMGESVFMSCHYLTSIIIEDGITEIHESMFADCEYLESIVIPASMMKIGDRAFYRCFDLDTISYGGTKDDWERITKGEFWSDGADSGNVTVTCRDGDIYLYI